VPADLVEELLIVRVRQAAIAQMMPQGVPQALNFLWL
jgi:hypothetical protein